MAVKTILTEPNKLLRQISTSVKEVGKEERQLMDDMLDTMYAANGIGLAAIQIGVPKRIIVMDLSKDENKKEPRYFVNPGVWFVHLVRLFQKIFLNLTKKGFVNIHASILPSWRGAAPIQRSIMNLDSETGISIMKMNEELDSGPVSNIYKVKIDKIKMLKKFRKNYLL